MKIEKKLILSGVLLLLTIIALVIFIRNDKHNQTPHITDNTDNSVNISDIPSIPVTISPTFPMPGLSSDNVDNFNLDYDYPPTKQAKNTVRIPILMYHHISTATHAATDNNWYISPEIFEMQLQYLHLKNYKSLTISEFYNFIQKGVNPTQKSVLLTFDDGLDDQYQNAYPLLKKYGFTGVFNIIVNKSGITNIELKQMDSDGMDIEPHGMNHLDLRYIYNEKKISAEVGASRDAIQKITGEDVVAYTYPFCAWNGTVVSYLQKSKFELAFSCDKGIDHAYKDRFVLHRIRPEDDFIEFEKQLSGIW